MSLVTRSRSTGGTATFGNKDVGLNKTVTLTGAVLAGADEDNYSLTSVGTRPLISPRSRSRAASPPPTRSMTATPRRRSLTRSLNGDVAGDAVTLTGGTATFGNKNVGTDKTVTLTGAMLAGADAGNYS